MEHFEQLQAKKTIKNVPMNVLVSYSNMLHLHWGKEYLKKSWPFSIRRRSIFYSFPNQEGVNCVVKICGHVLKYHSHIFPKNDSGTKEIISS